MSRASFTAKLSSKVILKQQVVVKLVFIPLNPVAEKICNDVDTYLDWNSTLGGVKVVHKSFRTPTEFIITSTAPINLDGNLSEIRIKLFAGDIRR